MITGIYYNSETRTFAIPVAAAGVALKLGAKVIVKKGAKLAIKKGMRSKLKSGLTKLGKNTIKVANSPKTKTALDLANIGSTVIESTKSVKDLTKN